MLARRARQRTKSNRVVLELELDLEADLGYRMLRIYWNTKI
jgi:hypothetical protein